MTPDIKVQCENPKAIIILSGKRKSGKDFIASFLLQRFGCESSAIVRLSGPLKERYAKENGLDYEKLLEPSDYKELFREKMIKWGEDIRNKDPGYFCRHAILQSEARSKRIWIVSDARRISDIKFFRDSFPDVTHAIRITASDSVRESRGWKCTEGVDDCESECGLDSYNEWDFQILNDNDEQMSENVNKIVETIIRS